MNRSTNSRPLHRVLAVKGADGGDDAATLGADFSMASTVDSKCRQRAFPPGVGSTDTGRFFTAGYGAAIGAVRATGETFAARGRWRRRAAAERTLPVVADATTTSGELGSDAR